MAVDTYHKVIDCTIAQIGQTVSDTPSEGSQSQQLALTHAANCIQLRPMDKALGNSRIPVPNNLFQQDDETKTGRRVQAIGRGSNYTLSHTGAEADSVSPEAIRRGHVETQLLQLSPVSDCALILGES